MAIREFSIDCQWQNNFSIICIQGESRSRFLRVHLQSNNEAIDLADNVIQLYVTKPDNTHVLDDFTIIDAKQGIIEIGLSAQVSAVSGKADCYIQSIDKNANNLIFNGLHIEIKPCNLSTIAESTDEYASLVKALAKVNPKLDAMDAKIREAAEAVADVQNEQLNMQNMETAWNTKEASYATAENERKTNETTRNSNEDVRKTNETNRISEWNTFKEQINTATTDANTATQNANTATTNANTATTNANKAKSDCDTATQNAITATNNVTAIEQAATDANTTLQSAKDAALKAQTDAETAKTNSENYVSTITTTKQACETATTNATKATEDCNTATTNANAATINANKAKADCDTATQNAITATTSANTAIENCKTATTNANTAKDDCVTATTNANAATQSANKAKVDCDTATQSAITAANNANHVQLYGDNGNWQTWDAVNQKYVDSTHPWKGERGAAFEYGKSYDTLDALKAEYPTGDLKGHLVGTIGYIWDGAQWKESGIDLSGYYNKDISDSRFVQSNTIGVTGGVAKYDDVKTHIDNIDIHVTTNEKTTWNSKLDETKIDVVGGIAGYDSMQTALAGKAKTTDIPTTAAQVGARPDTWMPTAADVGAAAKSTAVSITLAAANWAGTSAPYTQTLSIVGVTATSNQEFLPAQGITADQLTALQSANIVDGGQSAGSVTLKSYGDKPSIDIPLRVIVRGDM